MTSSSDGADGATRPDRLRRAAVAVEWVSLAGLLWLFLHRGFFVGWGTLNTDFPNYYLAAHLFRDGYPMERLNDWIWFQRQKDHAQLQQPLVGYIPSTLLSMLMIVPLTDLAPLQAKRVWLVMNLGLLIATGALIWRMTRLHPRRIALVILCAVVPLRTNFQFGQQHVVLLFLLTLGAWLYLNRRVVAAGIPLALATALKLYPGFFLLYFARKRQWRALAAMAGALVAIILAELWLVGVVPLRDYLVQIVPRALRGEYSDPYMVNLSSLTALLRRLLVAEPELNPHPLWQAPGLFAALQPLVQACILIPSIWILRGRRGDADEESLDLAAFVATLLMLSSGTSTYHFCALILAVALAVGHLLKTGQSRPAVGLMVAFILVCLPYGRIAPSDPAGLRILLGFPRVYPLTVLWLLCLVSVRRRSQPSGQIDVGRSRLVVRLPFLVAFTIVLALGEVGSLRHFRDQFSWMAGRLAVPGHSLIMTTPAVAGDDVFLTRMGRQGYEVVDLMDRTSFDAPLGTDLFHPALPRRTSEGWLEVASATSRIVRFDRRAHRVVATAAPVEVADATNPVISPDGRWLGFIRERRGRGSLWVLDRTRSGQSEAERELVGGTDEVMDLDFLRDGRIVLAARRDGSLKLFTTSPIGGAAAELPTSNRAARFPAASPDGQWLAYAREEAGQWQLWLMDLHTGDQRRLTQADCNFTTPAWADDSRAIVFATDCGRAMGHVALAKMDIGR